MEWNHSLLILYAQAHQRPPGPALLCILLFLAMIYFLPTMVGVLRGHQNALAIFMLNLLLGWTFVAWAIAMVWACTEVRRHHENER